MDEKNNQKKETYYKLNSDNIWTDDQKQETIAHHLSITSKTPVDFEQEQEKLKYPSGRRLRTYQGDIAAMMQQKQASEADIVIAEQKKQYADNTHKKKVDKKARNDALKNILAVCIAIGLLVVGGGSLYYILSRPNSTETITVNAIRPISADEEIKVMVPSSTSRREFISSLQKAAASAPIGDSVITHINLVQTGAAGNSSLPTSRFFQILEARAPASLIRSLNSSFMIGSHNGHVFMIFTNTFFESAFASMLDWETQMESDIGPFFTDTASRAATNKFEDRVVRNKDTRVLRDEIGNILFLYTFSDREYLVIVMNERTLSEVLARLSR